MKVEPIAFASPHIARVKDRMPPVVVTVEVRRLVSGSLQSAWRHRSGHTALTYGPYGRPLEPPSEASPSRYHQTQKNRKTGSPSLPVAPVVPVPRLPHLLIVAQGVRVEAPRPWKQLLPLAQKDASTA